MDEKSLTSLLKRFSKKGRRLRELRKWSLMLGIVLVVFGYLAAWFDTEDVVTIKVNDKERVNNGEVSKYLIYTESGTYQNTDQWLYSKVNSSDLQGKLRRDSTYTVKVVGWRVPILSKYQNIIEIMEK